MTNPMRDGDIARCERVAWVLQNRFKLNQSEMAARLGCSQSLVSRIVRKVQSPGRKFLDSLANSDPVISRAWLIAGDGEPLIDPRDSDEGILVPISQALLPGPPKSRQLTGEFRRVFSSEDTSRLYWWRVPADADVTFSSKQKIAGGDLLLVTTGEVCEPSSNLDGVLAVIRHGDDLVLAELEFFPEDEDEPGGLAADAFESSQPRKNCVLSIQTMVDLSGKVVCPPKVTIVERRSGKRVSPLRVDPQNLRISPRDVVGIVIELRREFRRPQPTPVRRKRHLSK